MSKIPETIRKAAEQFAYEHANDAHGEECVKSDGNDPDWQECYDDVKAAYIACYEKLMSGGPDGWVLERDTGDRLTVEECREILLYPANDKSLQDDFATMRHLYPHAGWRIVALKIIKIDEEPKP
jgi:hypothetical protein